MPWFNLEKNSLVPNLGRTFFQIFLVLTLNNVNRVKQYAWSSKLKKSEKVRPEFGTKQFYANHRFKESAPVFWISYCWVSNSIWGIFFTRITSLRSKLQAHFFCRYAPCYISRLKVFDSMSRMVPSPFMRVISIPRIMPWFFNNEGLILMHWIWTRIVSVEDLLYFVIGD